MVLSAEWGTGQVAWSMFWFFVFLLWFLVTIQCLWNIMKSPGLSGGAKALWTIAVLIFPFLGVLAYLVYSGPLDDPVRDQRMRDVYSSSYYPGT